MNVEKIYFVEVHDMNKIVITGGCGFIGTNLIDFLKRKNKSTQIVVLDNETLGKRKYISEFDVQFIHGDIRDKEVILKVFDGADAVVHLAADTRVLDSIEDPIKNFEIHVNGTFNVLNTVQESNIPLFVNASTGGAILGDVKPPVHEEMVPEPIFHLWSLQAGCRGLLFCLQRIVRYPGFKLAVFQCLWAAFFSQRQCCSCVFQKYPGGSRLECVRRWNTDPRLYIC